MRQVHAGDHVDGGEYVDIAGAMIWHFTAGEPHGPPTVLLHGLFASASTWGTQIAGFLEAGQQVFVPERTGHGHSPDVPGDFSCEQVAERTIAYLEQVVGRSANLVGWADGAAIALLVARDRPDLVNRLVFVGGYVNSGGRMDAEFVDRIARRDPLAVDYLRVHYDATSPDGPEHFAVIYDKTIRMLAAEPEYDIAEFAHVDVPTLVVVPDRGIVRLEHALELSRTLPRGRLAVIPGTYILPVESPELFNPLVLSFLAADPPSVWEFS
ncbi:alpha/beta hydrolase [Gordonia sp. zg691]|uniref:Alpha/beta hydrolase n=1 Tax=Gordonia jinghuaiqii TaxID=2758710 RepID=A0A7D7LUA3_9ACTN|nr:alpha/beta hydrolase [Gordonia jinghuaiqii]MBD0861842.1 alpha/beta hydrolase [Gordonia jinghuaiqii]MCR5977734.1 alpha/beta fold hydrolase [Gordonia jinghuaiqii]QMT02397.1 alpha/beta hydrolase [Gordonia jinghuaiqii]